jgi:hypothetical protein
VIVLPKKSRPLNLWNFEGIDWGPDDDEDGNYAHCAEHGVYPWVVDEVLGGEWVDVEMEVKRADFAIVGPNAKRNFMWTLLFDVSWKRGDWLRPVTGWDSRPKEIREWERVMGQEWKGSGQKRPRRK